MKDLLEHFSKMYYEGHPVITDAQYDALVDKYGELRTVGYSPDRGVSHFYSMYSLKKYYVGEELPEWSRDAVFTPKMDGAAISLLYIDGMLVQALTRGDGKIGIDVSERLVNIECINKLNIPIVIECKEITQIDGEIIAPISIENSRNYAAGALSLKDKEEFLSREIVFCAYALRPESLNKYYSENLATLESWGFLTVSSIEHKDYPTDGKVYRIDNNKKYLAEGYTSKHPRGAFALKYRNEGVVTQILDVIWQTGKSGKVTPVAILEPIKIDGALVSRATLNNVDFIEALGVEIGDSVRVERAGNIIPRIIEKVEE